MAITATYSPATTTLTVQGDNIDNALIASRDAAGTLLAIGGAVPVGGGSATVANTALIQIFSHDGADTIALDETAGPLLGAPVAQRRHRHPGHGRRRVGQAERGGRRRCGDRRSHGLGRRHPGDRARLDGTPAGTRRRRQADRARQWWR